MPNKPIIDWERWALPLFLLAAVLLRFATFSNPNLDADDQFYALIGQRMHQGLWPYVDIWDRKPLGLFVLYYLIAGVSTAAWFYHCVAALCAGATAWLIARITALFADARGGILAGMAYLLLLGPFDGVTGQSPVFYNLLMVTAVLIVLRSQVALDHGRLPRPVWLAMFLAGMAITFKQTALFEAALLGLWVVWHLHRAGAAKPGLILCLAITGALPFVLTALPYVLSQHWSEYWHAMVISNITKAPMPQNFTHRALIGSLLRLLPIAPLALWGLCSLAGQQRRFMALWVVAGILAYLSVPRFYPHYMLPLLPIVCALAGVVFARARGGLAAFATTAVLAMMWYNPYNFDWNGRATASMKALANAASQHDGGRGIFLFDGPTSIYSLTNSPILSPLVFPHHLNHAIERNVSHLDTNATVDGMLAKNPGAVVLTLSPRNFPPNLYAWGKVREYVKTHCQPITIIQIYEHQVITPIAIYGDCRAGGGTQG